MNKIFTAFLRIIFFFPIIGYCQSPITNQRIYDTIPNVPDLYIKRTAMFEAEPIILGQVIFLGNSITEGGDWQKLFKDSSILNRGIGGDNTYGLLKRLDEIIARKPSKLFILIGINDISKDIPVPVIAENYRKIIEKLQLNTPDTKIYIQSLLPLNPFYQDFPQHFDKQDEATQLNELLVKLSTKSKTVYINLEPIFWDSNKRLNEGFTVDGLHLNEKGYQVWAQFLKEKGYL